MRNPEVPNEAGFGEVKLLGTFVRNQNILELVWPCVIRYIMKSTQSSNVFRRFPSGFLHVVRRSPSNTSRDHDNFQKLSVIDDRAHHPSGDSNFWFFSKWNDAESGSSKRGWVWRGQAARHFCTKPKHTRISMAMCDKVHNEINAVIERLPSFSIGFLHVVRRSPSNTSRDHDKFRKLSVIDDRSHHPSGVGDWFQGVHCVISVILWRGNTVIGMKNEVRATREKI